MHVTNAGAKPIAFTTGEPVPAGVLLANTRYHFCYSNVHAGTGAWVVAVRCCGDRRCCGGG